MLALTPFRNLPRPVQVLLLLNLAVFLPAVLFSTVRANDFMGWIGYLVLVPELYTQPWRFVHIAPLHFLFNMLMLWMFGEEVCTWLGNRTFLGLYFFSAIFAGLFSVPFYASHLIGDSVQILGASGALFGVMVAYGWLFPERQMLFFFVIPMKARTAVVVFIIIDLLMSNSGDGIAHFTHLGGALAGIVFMAARSGFWGRWLWRMRKRTMANPGRVLEGDVGYYDEQKQLDAVLAKIARSGLGSLTAAERTYLQEASAKQRARRGL